jgi:phosphatidylserine decarboxylase
MTDVSRFVDKQVKEIGAPTGWLAKMGAQEDINFLLTNRVPRHALTLLMGRISRIRSRSFTKLAIGVWRRFTDLDLSEAVKTEFDSIQDCFTRELRAGARPIDPRQEVLCSPCDAIVGAQGQIEDGLVLQAKGMPYLLQDLVGPSVDLTPFHGGHYVTLRLTSSMYHRFHAPDDLHLQHVTYISGDTWNVNPIALKRIERLFCRNERAVLKAQLSDGTPMLIVPVAAILVASLRLHALPSKLHIRYQGPNELPTDVRYARGQEMGWFEHGSTIVVITPASLPLLEERATGQTIQMGQDLWSRNAASVTRGS